MAWVRLDDGFADHPKILAAGPFAMAAQVRALCYCARFLTNGRLSERITASIFRDLKPLKPSDMVKVGLWEKVGRKGYKIHDYLTYQPDREQVEGLRAKKAAAGRLGAIAKHLADAKARAIASAMPPSSPLLLTTKPPPTSPIGETTPRTFAHATDPNGPAPIHPDDALWAKLKAKIEESEGKPKS